VLASERLRMPIGETAIGRYPVRHCSWTGD
jgi:hypothetical protein